jgi:hypothetical protein
VTETSEFKPAEVTTDCLHLVCTLYHPHKNEYALGYGLDDRGSRVRFPAGLRIFLLTTASRPALGPTHPPNQWVPGALSLGVKRPGREADHSPPSSSEFKNACSYTSSPQYVFMTRCLVKHRANFTFTFMASETRSKMHHTLHCELLYIIHIHNADKTSMSVLNTVTIVILATKCNAT